MRPAKPPGQRKADGSCGVRVQRFRGYGLPPAAPDPPPIKDNRLPYFPAH